MTDLEFVNHAKRFVHAFAIRQGKTSKIALLTVQPSQQEICQALFDTIAAAQAALVANNCAGA